MSSELIIANALPGASQGGRFSDGQRVRVKAITPSAFGINGLFYGFIDGWCGVVGGYNSGAVRVVMDQVERGEKVRKEFFIPESDLELA